MAAYMEATGELLRGNRGKGASHDSHFNKAKVRAAIEKWYNGDVPVQEGGFEGPVSPFPSFSFNYSLKKHI
jgi:hypothetical protein